MADYKFDSPWKAASRTREQFTPSQLKRRRGEDAYREAHAAAKAAGKSGEEMHAAGIKAQNEAKTKPESAFSTDKWLAF